MHRPTAPRSTRPLAFLTSAVLGFALLLGSASTGHSQEPGPYPGLPYIPDEPFGGSPDVRNLSGWLNAAQVGLTGSVVSKQWARVPQSVSAVNGTFGGAFDDPDLQQRYDVNLKAFLIPTPGSPGGYGSSPLIDVRTVAFGSIPAEVSLQLRQRRDGGFPVPFNLDYRDETFNPGVQGVAGVRTVIYPTTLVDDVEVRVDSMKIDGVDLRVSDSCSTGARSRLELSSPRIERVRALDDTSDPEGFIDQDDGFFAINGGTLSGHIDIARFEGCLTEDGDDLDPILTSAISGTTNPVTVKIGVISCLRDVSPEGNILPAPSPATVESAGCRDLADPNPPKRVAVPEPLPFPGEAP